MPSDQSGETGPVAFREMRAYVATPTSEVTQVENRAAGATVHRQSGADEDGADDRPAADAVDAAHHADGEGEHAHRPRPEVGCREPGAGRRRMSSPVGASTAAASSRNTSGSATT